MMNSLTRRDYPAVVVVSRPQHIYKVWQRRGHSSNAPMSVGPRWGRSFFHSSRWRGGRASLGDEGSKQHQRQSALAKRWGDGTPAMQGERRQSFGMVLRDGDNASAQLHEGFKVARLWLLLTIQRQRQLCSWGLRSGIGEGCRSSISGKGLLPRVSLLGSMHGGVLLFFTAPSQWPPAAPLAFSLHKLEPPSTSKSLAVNRAFHKYVVSRLLAKYPQPSYLIPHWPSFCSLLFLFTSLFWELLWTNSLRPYFGNCFGPILYLKEPA